MIKIALVGDTKSNKVELAEKFVYSNKLEKPEPSIGSFCDDTILTIDDKDFRIQVYDTPAIGQHFSMLQTFIKGAEGIVLLYSVTDATTFHNLDEYIDQIKESAKWGTVVYLVGNNSHPENERVITEEQGKMKSEEIGGNFMEISSKTGENVTSLFETLTKKILPLRRSSIKPKLIVV